MNSLVNQFTVYSCLRHAKMARDEIVSFQNRQLRRLVAHAYENVPYYRRLFDRSGIGPKDIQSVADLSLIPITSKKDIQLLPVDNVVARGIDPESLNLRRTSGSSGEPFSIRRTPVEETILAVIRSRATRYFGLRVVDRLARVKLVRPGEARDNQRFSLVRRILGSRRRIRVNCLLPLEEILQKLRDFRPDVLAGYPGVLSKLAQISSDEDRRLIHPRFIRVGGEVMTPLMRNQIAEGFKAPVFETYASWEFSLLAWECKETGEYHTCDDGLIFEVIKDGRPAEPGERGEVVGTALHSFAMPLIRFKLGDIVTKGSETCRCGQPFSTIRAIQGRMIDYLTLPDGRMLHPYEITGILRQDAASWTRQYQVIQERVDQITMKIVPSFTPQPEKVALLEKSVSDLLGQGVEFRVVFVPEIQLESSGKFRVFRSLVQSDYDGIEWENEH